MSQATLTPIACKLSNISSIGTSLTRPASSANDALRLNPLLEHGKLMKPRASIRPSAEDGAGLSKWLLIDVPKKLFTHFYAFGFLTSTAVLVDVFFRGGAMITAEIQVHEGCVCFVSALRCDLVLVTATLVPPGLPGS